MRAPDPALIDAERLAETMRVDRGILDLISDYQTLGPMDRMAVCKLARVLAGRPAKPSPT